MNKLNFKVSPASLQYDMQTYKELKAGKLAGVTELKISENLELFPEEIFDLADTLELLDLSGNMISELPKDFGRLKKLRILFLSNNLFTEVPSVLAECPELSMVGFKSNQITSWPEGSMPPKLRWLILTDNKIEKIPQSIGDLDRLQKLMLAGNKIETLPDTMAQYKNLELIRLSANRLRAIPKWLFRLPRLSWLACAGNPITSAAVPGSDELADIAWEEVSLYEELGEGASGIISKGRIKDEDAAAIKIFKGDVTSDGYPSDEMSASIAAGKHCNLNTPHGKIADHPDEKQALVFPLIPSIYCNLGNHPSFESCTRDNYDNEASFPLPLLMRIISDVASAALHLHQRGVNHGDLYAHNILIDREGHSLLGDFGAATCYERTVCSDAFEKLEVRAFGCLLEELLDRCDTKNEGEKEKIEELKKIRDLCLNEETNSRPTFEEIIIKL